MQSLNLDIKLPQMGLNAVKINWSINPSLWDNKKLL